MEDENVPKVVENKDLSLEFICEDETARLYMDGLDTLPERDLEIGEDDIAYISPEIRRIYLYKNSKDSDNPDGYYSLIPGHYRIKVVVKMYLTILGSRYSQNKSQKNNGFQCVTKWKKH